MTFLFNLTTSFRWVFSRVSSIPSLSRVIHVVRSRYIFHRRLYIYRLIIDGNQVSHNNCQNGIQIRRISSIDPALEQKLFSALGHVEFNPPFDIAEARRKLESGHLFIVAERQDALVAWLWVAVGSVFIPEIDAWIHLRADEGLNYNLYISRECRGMGIHSRFLWYEKGILKNYMSHLWGHIYDWNKASQKSTQKAGFEVFGLYHYIKILCIRIRYVSKIYCELK